MNERIEGWTLGAAMVAITALLAATVYFGIQAFGGERAEIAVSAPSPTPVETTSPVSKEDPSALPTAVQLPDAPPEVTAVQPTPDPAQATDAGTSAEPTASATAAPTSTPLPTSTPDPNAEPTATPDPNAEPTDTPGPDPTPDPDQITISCEALNPVPAEIDPGEGIGPFRATLGPETADLADVHIQFDFDDDTGAIAAQTGLVAFEAEGTYSITAQARQQGVGIVATDTCAVAVVKTTPSLFNVACTVDTLTGEPFEDATVGETMEITVAWTPASDPLWLQFSFDGNPPITIVENANSGVTQNGFLNSHRDFEIFWKSDATGEQGTIFCPAYPTSF